MLAVRKAPGGSHNSILWRKESNGEKVPRPIGGNAFLPTLFSLFGWNKDCQYKLSGTVHRKDDETVLIFNSRDAVLLYEEISSGEADPSPDDNAKKKIKRQESAFPSDWADSFGDDYYTSQKKFEDLEPEDQEWQTHKNGIAISKETRDNVTPPQKAAENIKQLLADMGVTDD